MRFVHVAAATALALAAVACAPPSPEQSSEEAAAPAEDPAMGEVLAAAASAVGSDLGAPVQLQVDTLRTQGDWAWLVALPRTQAGEAFDFSRSRYAEAAAAGAFDGGGTTYVLLQRSADGWTVRDFVIGPTDVAYMDWPQRYGAPPELLGLPAE